jgi:molybdopterin molybdotransferase
MLSVEEAQDRLLEAVGSPLPVEDVPLAQALDRALAEPIRSAVDLPPWDNSSMDGFAVHAADVAGATATAPIRLRVVGDVRAGGSPHVDVPPGCAVRIATGAPMPPSADAVVPVETTIVAEEGADSAIGEAARVEPARVEPAPAGSGRAGRCGAAPGGVPPRPRVPGPGAIAGCVPGDRRRRAWRLHSPAR